MALYVVYRAPTESKARSTIPTRLKDLGCKQIHRAVWKINEKKVNYILKVLENNQPIILKRLREIKNPKICKKKKVARLGSLIIVIFALPEGANREKVKNYLKRAACIRLRRSVYAFSQKHSFYEKEPKLVDALKLVNFIKENQGKVKIISRVVIENSTSVERLLQETTERVEQRASDIISSCKGIYVKALKGSNYGVLRDRFSRIKRRYLILKKVVSVYEAWLKIDFSKSLMRAYHAIRKVDLIINPT
ncbi:MAG: hypothetical protein ACOC80_16970 [Petrotogales bacterium]